MQLRSGIQRVGYKQSQNHGKLLFLVGVVERNGRYSHCHEKLSRGCDKKEEL